jgi:hypothetical protein
MTDILLHDVDKCLHALHIRYWQYFSAGDSAVLARVRKAVTAELNSIPPLPAPPLPLNMFQINRINEIARQIRNDRKWLPSVEDGEYRDPDTSISVPISAAEIRAKLEERITRNEAELAAMGVTLLPDPPPKPVQLPTGYWGHPEAALVDRLRGETDAGA